jgi:aryl-alcohol dehydrogenase-like predicted oxidoreductase
MKYNTLPNTNIKVSELCLGTMTWGRQNTQEEGFEQMNYAFDQGLQFWDTAELYPVPTLPELYGGTEWIIGNWLKANGKRSEIVLATKIAGKAPFTKHIRTTGFTPEGIDEAIGNSLKRLQTDYIDLYQLHWPMRNTNFFGKRDYPSEAFSSDEWKDNIYEVLTALAGHIKAGRIRYVGLSNETPWGVMRFIEEHKKDSSLPKMITVQNPYSLLNRLYEVGLAEVSHRENVGLLPYSPLGFGVLSGKYLGGEEPKDARVTLFPNYNRYSGPVATSATEAYAEIAKKYELSLPQMALAYLRIKPFVTSTIIGATSMSQLIENIDSAYLELSDEVLAQIEAVHQMHPNPAP